jgi:hypothetical protein
MPSHEILMSFKEGLNIIQHAKDFATLQQAIHKMVSICPPEEVHLAKDAIARVIKSKQVSDFRGLQGNPQALAGLDAKYKDLYLILRKSQSQVPPKAPSRTALPGGSSPGRQMAKRKGFGGLNIPTMIDWLRTKRKYLIAGGAVGALGGAFMLYKQLTEEKPDKNPDNTSSFDRTIKSIHKYKAFTQMMNDPNFSGNYTDMINGDYKKPKKKKEVKKKDVKSDQWSREERSLMNDMDSAFNSLAVKPELAYQLPQLPAPKNIDPKALIDDSPIEMRSLGQKTGNPQKKIRKPRKVRKTRRPKPETQATPPDSPEPAVIETIPTRKAKPKKPRNRPAKTTSSANSGRLIPIVKRTKRVRKVKT